MRLMHWRTSSSRSLNASAAHSGRMPVSSCRRERNSSSEGEHAAVGVVDEDDLLGAQEVLGDRERADLVVRHDAACVSDHMSVALLKADQAGGNQARIHAGDDSNLLRGRKRQIPLVEALGVPLAVLTRVSVGARIPQGMLARWALSTLSSFRAPP
jgi:hypothetical protein